MSPKSKNTEDRDIELYIKDLSAKIFKLQELYYIKNNPAVSDRKFDELLKELCELEAKHPHLIRPDSPSHLLGSDMSNDFAKLKHRLPVLSLENTYNLAELMDWVWRLLANLKKEDLDFDSASLYFQVQWKIDGTTLVLYYQKGVLKEAITRGTGFVGNDVTENALTIRSIPKQLKEPQSLLVRGEVYMLYQDFTDFNEAFGMIYANPRNLAAGSLKHKKSNEVAKRPLRWLGFDASFDAILDDTLDENIQQNNSDQETLKLIHKLGLPIDQAALCVPLKNLEKTIRKFENKRNKLGFPVDGLVIKLDDVSLRKLIGVRAKAPRWAVAYKFEAEEAITKVKAIETYVGRTGRVTPRAVLEPVQLSGSTVSYATLHNANYIEKLDLRLDSEVKISKRGEIIPAIEEVVLRSDNEPFLFPRTCPSCQTKLIREEEMVDWFCVNEACQERFISSLIFFCGRKQMDIDGMGEKACRLLFENGFVKSIPDIYKLGSHKEKLEQLEGFGPRSVAVILSGIEKSKEQDFQTLLVSLGLREIGPKVVELLMDAGYDDYYKIEKLIAKENIEQKIIALKDAKPSQANKLVKEYFPELSEIHGIGWQIILAISTQVTNPKTQSLFRELGELGLNLKQDSDRGQAEQIPAIFKNQIWCITGTFENFRPRELALKEIKKRGGKISSQISTKTSHLLLGSNGGTKQIKAEELGLKIISEEDFLVLLA